MNQVLVLKNQKKLFFENYTLDNKKVLVDNTANIKREAERIARERASRQAAEQQRLAQIQPGQTDLDGNVIKIQTELPQYDTNLDKTTGWEGVEPVQQVSAQPLHHMGDYLQGNYPDEFWSLVGGRPEDTQHHGGSRHRVDDEGRYVAVGVRGESPTGDLPTTGPARPRKGKPNYPQDYGVRVTQKKDMPSHKNIVVKPMKVKKHAETPAAKKHKKEYDTKYESTPERRKYRTELTQERRNRHVAGKGGKDMSHTAQGTIVPEDMHANRARHFKERGTLKKKEEPIERETLREVKELKRLVKVKKPVKKMVVIKQQCPTPSKKGYDNEEEAYQDASMMGLGIYQCPCGQYHFTSS